MMWQSFKMSRLAIIKERLLSKKETMIFETERLFVRRLQESDANLFFDLMSNPNVMSLIPQTPFSKEKSDSELTRLISIEQTSNTKIWGLCEKTTNEFIGISGFLKNNESENEIAYRIREKHWNKGFGTEIAKGLLDFGFNKKNMELITADVFIENVRSIKILSKFFILQKEFFNNEDDCIDRRYVVKKEN